MLFALLSSTGLARAGAGDMNLDAQLIWGTNDTKTDAKLKPADPELVRKLRQSPFKWDHYFEMHREQIPLKLNQEKTVSMSRNCVISVTNLKDQQVQLRLFGKGVLANTVQQALPKGQLLIIGGNAENSTAWFVVLRQVEK
ncbi:MAG TPA: hypothetical protein VN873_17715 [Candidatus Angelobacter sp.]|nr:hypothetical protein [Candidatus Angelobacter sp.]